MPAREFEGRIKALPGMRQAGEPGHGAVLLPRCRDVDLNRWLSGKYVIPGRETDPEDAE